MAMDIPAKMSIINPKAPLYWIHITRKYSFYITLIILNVQGRCYCCAITFYRALHSIYTHNHFEHGHVSSQNTSRFSSDLQKNTENGFQ